MLVSLGHALLPRALAEAPPCLPLALVAQAGAGRLLPLASDEGGHAIVPALAHDPAMAAPHDELAKVFVSGWLPTTLPKSWQHLWRPRQCGSAPQTL